MVATSRVAARFLQVKILTIFELFPDPKINLFLARNLGLRETRLYMAIFCSQIRLLKHFFPDKDLMEVFRNPI